MANYLLKLSSAGNRFALADSSFFKIKIPCSWPGSYFKTTHSFLDFSQLPKLDPAQRQLFMQQLFLHKDLKLTDGLACLKKSKTNIFDCDFYNKDGSMAGMCGNLACCLSFYMKHTFGTGGYFRINKQKLMAVDGGVLFQKKPKYVGDYVFYFKSYKIPYALINAGVPHAVINCQDPKICDFDQTDILKNLAKTLRFQHPKKSNEGMNVTFFKIQKDNHLKARTFERGVEDWTLACGTGALAASWLYAHDSPVKSADIFVKMPGGVLKVQLSKQLGLFSKIKTTY